MSPFPGCSASDYLIDLRRPMPKVSASILSGRRREMEMANRRAPEFTAAAAKQA